MTETIIEKVHSGWTAIIGVLATLDGEFWAAIAGAVVGGVISYIIQWQSLRHAERDSANQKEEERGAIAYQLFVKTMRITSNLKNMHEYIEKEIAKVPETDMHRMGIYVQPLATHTSQINFSEKEIVLLPSLGDDELMNKMISLDTIHNDTIELFRFFAETRSNLVGTITPEMLEKIAGSCVKDTEYSIFIGRLTALNSLIAHVKNRAELDYNEAKSTLENLHIALTKSTRFDLKFRFKQNKNQNDK